MNIANVFPPQEVTNDGYATIEVVSRFGRLDLRRQVVVHGDSGDHVMPGNGGLPPHNGVILTRGLQEAVCLLSLDLPLASVERLLGWQTQDDALLSSTMNRTLVKQHGGIIREAEAAEVADLLAADDLSGRVPQLVPHTEPRRQGSWPVALNEVVEQALAADEIRPPEGVSMADWERVLAARRAEQSRTTEELRRLGPEVAENQIVAAVDEVLTRKPERRSWWQLRTARIATTDGYRYLRGTGDAFLMQLLVCLLMLGLEHNRPLLFLADGARWIRDFYARYLQHLPQAPMVLDWYHLRHKVYRLSSMICRSKKAKRHLLWHMAGFLWRGDVTAALKFLEDYRPLAKNAGVLDELITDLDARHDFIPNYQDRRRQRRFIGTAQVEKANDLIVARRQKNQGMHWSLETSDALAALKTLMLNGGWSLYWQQPQLLALTST